MEKTYSALIERLKKSCEWHNRIADRLECQPDLSDYERQKIAEDKAICGFLEKVIRIEEG